jgi:biotin operon repressor
MENEGELKVQVIKNGDPWSKDSIKDFLDAGSITVPEAIQMLKDVGMTESEAKETLGGLIESNYKQNIMIYSSLAYQLIFSMSKIKVDHTVPFYLRNLMGRAVTDGWYGDLDDGSKCNKLACRFVIGGNGKGGTVKIFFFCFGSEDKDFYMVDEVKIFKFCALVLQDGDKWYVLDRLTEKDFDRVFSLVDGPGDDVYDAVNILSMVETQIIRWGTANPLPVFDTEELMKQLLVPVEESGAGKK